LFKNILGIFNKSKPVLHQKEKRFHQKFLGVIENVKEKSPCVPQERKKDQKPHKTLIKISAELKGKCTTKHFFSLFIKRKSSKNCDI
jgi:hypothetical protein